jgi:hypothetical protein
MDSDERQQALSNLAAQIVQRRLTAPVRMLLEAIGPLSFLASQAALMIHPFVPGSDWRIYITALTDESGWNTLYRILDGKEC